MGAILPDPQLFWLHLCMAMLSVLHLFISWVFFLSNIMFQCHNLLFHTAWPRLLTKHYISRFCCFSLSALFFSLFNKKPSTRAEAKHRFNHFLETFWMRQKSHFSSCCHGQVSVSTHFLLIAQLIIVNSLLT